MRKSEHVTIPMTTEMLARIRAAAAVEGRPVSNWARQVFERALWGAESVVIVNSGQGYVGPLDD